MPTITSIPEPLVASLVSAMDRDGIAMLPQFPHESELHALQRFAGDRVDAFGEQAGFSGTQAINQTVLGDVADLGCAEEIAHHKKRPGILKVVAK